MRRAFCPICGYVLHPTCPACEGGDMPEDEPDDEHAVELSDAEQDRMADAFFAERLQDSAL